MAIQRIDEILDKALQSDANVIPRYRLVDANGQIVADDIELQLKNPILQAGTPYNAALMTEVLAASGEIVGAGPNYTLDQPGYVLSSPSDPTLRPVLVIFKTTSAPTNDEITLNINNTGAKVVVDYNYKRLTKPLQGTVMYLVYSYYNNAYRAIASVMPQSSGGPKSLWTGNFALNINANIQVSDLSSYDCILLRSVTYGVFPAYWSPDLGAYMAFTIRPYTTNYTYFWTMKFLRNGTTLTCNYLTRQLQSTSSVGVPTQENIIITEVLGLW